MTLSRWAFVFSFFLGHQALNAQSFSRVAFSVGSYDQKTEEVRTVAPEDLWIVDDMDDGTIFVVTKQPYGLAVAKKHGIIFIQSINLQDSSAGLMLIGTLPIKIPSSPTGTTVHFTCEKGKFIYLYNKTK